jgi:hypothetical protein
MLPLNQSYVLRSGMELIDFRLLGASQAVLITYMIL